MKLKDGLKLAGIFLGVFLVDFFSKFFVHRHIPLMDGGFLSYPFGGIAVFRNFIGVDFSLNHVTNTGAAWGILQDYQPYLVLFRCALLIGLSFFLFGRCKEFRKLVPYALIMGGAFGNIFDYFLYGHVVDMFHFVLWGYSYPVFNVADASIFSGVAIVVLSSFFAHFKESKLYNAFFVKTRS